jgi:hypothetical protein
VPYNGNYATWNGAVPQWEKGAGSTTSIALQDIGTWALGYRPKKMKATIQVDPFNPTTYLYVYMYNSSMNSWNTYLSNVGEGTIEVTVDLGSNNLDPHIFYIYSGNSGDILYVKNIEFRDEIPSVSPSASTSPSVSPNPPPEWEQHFDNNDLEPYFNYAAWVTNYWHSGTSFTGLIMTVPKAGTSWAVGYRPVRYRITVDLPSQMDIAIMLSDNETGFGYKGFYSVPAGVSTLTSDTINWTGREDIAIVEADHLDYTTDFKITNIEFEA